ncbi:hypothetical protein D3C80_1967700 [compost metagenome]
MQTRGMLNFTIFVRFSRRQALLGEHSIYGGLGEVPDNVSDEKHERSPHEAVKGAMN